MANLTKHDSDLLQLIQTSELASIGPAPRATRETIPALNSRLDAVFGASAFPEAAKQLIRSLVLLWHDHLDASHSISQTIHTRDGSYLHGIMHRREPDYGNAGYWFHRVGDHPSFVTIGRRIHEMKEKNEEVTQRLAPDQKLNPFAMIELCEEAAGKGAKSPETTFLERLQQIEFEVLLEHFMRVPSAT